jgi:hypothetical protein
LRFWGFSKGYEAPKSLFFISQAFCRSARQKLPKPSPFRRRKRDVGQPDKPKKDHSTDSDLRKEVSLGHVASTRYLRLAHPAHREQNQKTRTFDALPKPDNSIRYRQENEFYRHGELAMTANGRSSGGLTRWLA